MGIYVSRRGSVVGSYNGGSAWLCQHLWDHYLFTRDKDFLQWAYPVMKGAAQFYADLLIEEPEHRWLVIAPANSPENHFQMTNGQQASICMGPTMMQQQVRYLFGACIESSQILGIDPDFRNELIAKRARLAPTQIGSDGRIMEWLQEYAEPEPQHRHVSHLWGLYPGDEIHFTHAETGPGRPQKSLEVRGDESVGWSLANKALLRARLGDGNHAWLLVRKALFPVTSQDIRYDNGGGVYVNCSMPAHHIRSMETLASQRPSAKCYCSHRRTKLNCYRRCRTHGKAETFPACAREADFRWTRTGKTGN